MFRTVSLLFVFLFGLTFSLHAQKEWSDKELQKLYIDFLGEEGYRPEVDSDGDVAFKMDGKSYFFYTNEDDNNYFSFNIANIWPIESAEERSQVLEAVNAVNASTKVVKAQVIKDNVWLSIEILLTDPKDFKASFERMKALMDSGIEKFVSEMRG